MPTAQTYIKKAKANKSAHAKRSAVFTMRLTPIERGNLEVAAKKCGMKVSAYIRAIALGYKPKARFTEEERVWMRNLVSIRNDFVKFANAFSAKSKEEKAVLFQKLSFFLEWYKELFPLTDALTKYLQFLRQANRFLPSTTTKETKEKKI